MRLNTSSRLTLTQANSHLHFFPFIDKFLFCSFFFLIFKTFGYVSRILVTALFPYKKKLNQNSCENLIISKCLLNPKPIYLGKSINSEYSAHTLVDFNGCSSF